MWNDFYRIFNQKFAIFWPPLSNPTISGGKQNINVAKYIFPVSFEMLHSIVEKFDLFFNFLYSFPSHICDRHGERHSAIAFFK